LSRGPGNLSQNGQKPTQLLMLHTKNLKPKTKKFLFIADLPSLKQRSSTIEWRVTELQSGAKIAAYAGFLSTI